MQITTIIRWNLAAIVALGLYGCATNEPYWREVGHGPYLYDCLFWIALVMNGPSGFAADYLSRLGSDQAEIRFLMQFILWCALLWPQWKLYHALALWCGESRSRQFMLYSLAILIVPPRRSEWVRLATVGGRIGA